MSDVSFSASLQYDKDKLSNAVSVSQTASQATAGVLLQTLRLGTAVSQVSTATIGTLGMCLAQSINSGALTASTCTITFGQYSGGVLYGAVRLRPGEPAVMRLGPGNYAAQAAAEGSRLVLTILED